MTEETYCHVHMKRPIAISLSPNTSYDDVRRSLDVLMKPASWKATEKVMKVEQLITKQFEDRHVIATSSGRQALYMILKALHIGAGDEVILQAFTCIAVPEPVLWVGAKPVYTDIREQSFNIDEVDLEKKITPRTKAVIIQHTFGIPGPIERCREICQARGITLIEDCAHAFGARLMGKTVGTFTDIAFLSFGRDKMLSSVFGGAVVTSSLAIAEAVRNMQKDLSYPPFLWLVQQLLHPIAFAAIMPLYFTMDIGKALLVAAQYVRMLSKAVQDEEREGAKPRHVEWRYSAALAELLALQLSTCNERLQRRRLIAHMYQKALQETHVTLPEIYSGCEPSWLRFPVLTKEASSLIGYSKKRNILLGDWYNAPLVPGDCSLDVFHYTRGSCPVAEKAASRIANLPTYPSMTDEQVDEVIQCVRSF